MMRPLPNFALKVRKRPIVQPEEEEVALDNDDDENLASSHPRVSLDRPHNDSLTSDGANGGAPFKSGYIAAVVRKMEKTVKEEVKRKHDLKNKLAQNTHPNNDYEKGMRRESKRAAQRKNDPNEEPAKKCLKLVTSDRESKKKDNFTKEERHNSSEGKPLKLFASVDRSKIQLKKTKNERKALTLTMKDPNFEYFSGKKHEDRSKIQLKKTPNEGKHLTLTMKDPHSENFSRNSNGELVKKCLKLFTSDRESKKEEYFSKEKRHYSREGKPLKLSASVDRSKIQQKKTPNEGKALTLTVKDPHSEYYSIKNHEDKRQRLFSKRRNEGNYSKKVAEFDSWEQNPDEKRSFDLFTNDHSIARKKSPIEAKLFSSERDVFGGSGMRHRNEGKYSKFGRGNNINDGYFEPKFSQDSNRQSDEVLKLNDILLKRSLQKFNMP